MRIRSLDGLRGAAALTVVLGHFRLIVIDNFSHPILAAPGIGEALNLLGLIGGKSVWLFFVLSGLVLTMLALREGGMDYGRYVLSRLVRLYLPVFAAVGFTVITILLIPRSTTGYGAWIDAHPSSLTVNAVTADLALLGGVSGHLTPLWSLRFEILFSLLLIVYVAIFRKIHPLLGLVGAIGLTTVGGIIGDPMLLYMPMFAIGVGLAFAWSNLQRRVDRLTTQAAERALSPLIAIVGVSIAVALNVLPWVLGGAGIDPWLLGTLDVPASMVGITLLIVLVGMNQPLIRFFESRPLQWLGAVSFSLYLVHEPILIGSVRLFGVSAVSLLAGLAIAFVVAHLFARFVEKPAHTLSQRLRGPRRHEMIGSV